MLVSNNQNSEDEKGKVIHCNECQKEKTPNKRYCILINKGYTIHRIDESQMKKYKGSKSCIQIIKKKK